jgi:Cu/Zn superoxide dismutase
VDYGYNWDTTEGRAFVLHDFEGTRISCELLLAQNVVNMNVGNVYPDYNGNLTVGGYVESSFQRTHVIFHYDLDGADPDCVNGPINGTANSCGIHIHEGKTCDDAAEVGGHYYNTALFSEDPWTYDAFYTETTGRLFLDFGYGYSTSVGRAFVIHDRAGARISCDILDHPRARFVMEEFNRYPDYSGPLNVSGAVLMEFQMTNVEIYYELDGVDPACQAGPADGVANSCGIHIHEGMSCENTTLVGGHFWNDMNGTVSDPWVYDAYYSGNTGALRVEYGYDWEQTAGRAFVIHDRTGDRVTCTMLPSFV